MKKLERTLSLPGAIAVSIGGMLSGIFVLPGLAVGITGSSVWLAFLVAALCILPAVLSKSELGTAMPKSGGTYVYIERAFGPLFGTIAGIGLWLSLLLKSAFSLVGLSAYLYVVVNIDEAYTKAIALLALLLIFLLNIFGLKKVEKTQLFIVSVSIISLIVIIVLGFNSFDSKLTEPVFSDGTNGFIAGVAFLYISYAGVTKIAAIAGEIKNPAKNLPLTMIISLFLITTIYCFVALALVGNVEASILATDIKPIHTLFQTIGGDTFGLIAGVVGVLTLMSMANSGVLASSRFPFAMSNDGLLPSYLAGINSRFMTPVSAILTTSTLIALAIIFLDVVKIAKLASAFKVLMFIFNELTVIVLRETNAQWYKPTFKSPLYPYVQIFGILSGIVLLAFLGVMPVVSVLGVVVLGFLIFLVYGSKSDRSGVASSYGVFSSFFKDPSKIREYSDEHEDTEDIISTEAEVVVPLLGDEESPEMLVEISSAINSKNSVQAFDITEVPNQTDYSVFMQDSPASTSLKRRIKRLSESKNLSVGFDAVVTYELSQTINRLSAQDTCKWLVMGWGARPNSGIFITNPIGWLLANINSNLALYKDNGVRYIGKVVLALRPGRKDKNFIGIADSVCKHFGASLTLLHVVPQNGQKTETIKYRSEEKLKQYNVKANVEIIKSDKPVDTISEISAGYDLLILGTPEKDNWIKVLFGGGKDKFTERAACSVLRITLKD
ncbi:MAG: universal stress protein [Flavobacteriaceae bacterium]|nr:universal stress protein [Flavobacteriaceae bacterium]